MPGTPMTRWFGSFYWRIGVAFVLFVLGVITAQSLIVSYQLDRSSSFGPYPNELAAEIAADVSAALAQNVGDLDPVLQAYRAVHPSIYVVLTDGSEFSVGESPLPIAIRRTVDDTLSGLRTERSPESPRFAGPVVTAPIHLDGRLRGLLVLPPPGERSALRGLGRLLSLPGTLLLCAATVLAAFVIFAPARRRLVALEAAAVRMGSGDLDARAVEGGRDEVGRVASAFNHMGEELAARDHALRTSDQLRRQMLADVSHELKTPLTAMRGYLETLRMPEARLDAETRERYLDTVDQQTRRLERIVKDLTDLSRLESHVGDIHPRLFAVRRLFDLVVRRYERQAETGRIRIEVDVVDEVDQMVADPDRLEQVIDNLVANALRHTPPGGRITLRAVARGDAAVLSVSDSGPGIAPAHLPFVFERFYRADEARAASSGGSGLGLSIARAIVERHSGTIDVTSEPGRTTFTIVLPHART